MAINKTPQEVYDKYARNTKNAVEFIKRGVNGVTEAPGEKAAAAQEKMRQNLMAAIDDGTWADRVKSVTLAQWKDAMLTKGVNRIAQGVDGAKDKLVAFYEEFFPFLENVQKKIEAMPDVTLEDSISRATEYMRMTAGFKRAK